MNALTPAQAESLVEIRHGQLVTTSQRIADAFGRRHANVLQAIDRLSCSELFRQLNFQSAPYIDAQGKPRLMVEITRDGCAFLIMGFSGTEAARWKEGFIAEFNRMEAELRAGDAKQLARVQIELARTQRQLIVAQKALLTEARRRLREVLPARPAVASSQMPLPLEGGAA